MDIVVGGFFLLNLALFHHQQNRGANELYTKVKLEGVPCVRWPRWVHEELYFAGGNKPSKPATVGKQ